MSIHDMLDEAQRDLSSSNNIFTPTADECEAESSDVSRVSAGTLSADIPIVLASPSGSPLSTPPSSPSLTAQAKMVMSLMIPPHMPFTYPTPADQIDRHAEFEAETSAQRAISRAERDIISSTAAYLQTEVSETRVSGGHDNLGPQSGSLPGSTPNQMTASTFPEAAEAPPPEAPYSAFAPESSEQATDRASNIISDMASNITPDVKEVANDVQKEDPMDQKAVVEASEEPIPTVRTIADVILDEVQASNKVSRILRQALHTLTPTSLQKQFVQGDVAMIVDASDLKRTLLLPSSKLLAVAPNLPNRFSHLEDVTTLKRIFLLTNLNERDDTAMPRLHHIDPSQTLNQFTASQHIPITRARATAEKARVKKEEDGTIEDDEEGKTKIDWLKAYKTVFGIIVGFSRPWIFKSLSDDAHPLLPQIHGVLNIAGNYGATSALQPALELLIKDFMQAKTLWKAVADDPLDWLTISDAAKDAMVYEEALTHLVGSYPIYGERMRSEPDVPAAIQSMVEKKSSELQYFKMAVDQELLTLNLEFEIEPDRKGKKKEGSRRPADNDFGTAARQTHYQWLRYIQRQFLLLQHPGRNGDPASTPKLMSFYRGILAGGDNYLPPEDLIATWSSNLEACRNNKIIRETLKHLKNEAAKIVTPLTKSTLQYEQKEELEYLTCVKIDKSDIPWEKEEEDVEMEEE